MRKPKSLNNDLAAFIQYDSATVILYYTREEFSEAHEKCTQAMKSSDALRARIEDSSGIVWDSRNGMNITRR